MNESHHAIKVVSLQTGLSAHVIRVWEKRYGAVEPERTGTNRRLYSGEQIERLNLLREITNAGHRIGAVARLPTEKLRELAAENNSTNGPKLHAAPSPTGAKALLEECIAALRKLDSVALETALKRGGRELGAQGMLQRLIAPLVQTMGALWREGSITSAHEHFASSVIRVFLSEAAKPIALPESAPVVVVATPAGQIHELGALLAAAAAANLGWNVTYLGANLPAEEISGAARQNRARAVALSVVYPEDDPRLEAELTRLREALPPETALIVGGRAMPAYREHLENLGATTVEDLNQLFSSLDGLRKPSKATAVDQ